MYPQPPRMTFTDVTGMVVTAVVMLGLAMLVLRVAGL